MSIEYHQRTLSFQISHYFRYTVLRWYTHKHMNMIWHTPVSYTHLLLEIIKELKKKNNTAMILITHDLGVVASVSDDVAVVYAGEILEYGTREDIFLSPRHPYTIALFGAIPDITVDVRRLANIEGLPPDPADLSLIHI